MPVLEGVPCFAPMSAVQLRPQETVVMRAAGLACMSYRTKIRTRFLKDLYEFMLYSGMFAALTTIEKEFYFSPNIEEEPLLAFFSWYIESCHALFWALGHLDGLAYPDTATHTDRLFHLFFAADFEEFRQKSKLRSPALILDATDLYFRYRAICQRAEEMGEEDPPGMLRPEIIRLRYAALLWLVGREWDDVQAMA